MPEQRVPFVCSCAQLARLSTVPNWGLGEDQGLAVRSVVKRAECHNRKFPSLPPPQFSLDRSHVWGRTRAQIVAGSRQIESCVACLYEDAASIQ